MIFLVVLVKTTRGIFFFGYRLDLAKSLHREIYVVSTARGPLLGHPLP